MTILSDLINRARYAREYGNFDSLHGELLDQVEFLEHELNAETDRANEHFDAHQDAEYRVRQWREAASGAAETPDELEQFIAVAGQSIIIGPYGKWGAEALEFVDAKRRLAALEQAVARVREALPEVQTAIAAGIRSYVASEAMDLSYHEPGTDRRALEKVGHDADSIAAYVTTSTTWAAILRALDETGEK